MNRPGEPGTHECLRTSRGGSERRTEHEVGGTVSDHHGADDVLHFVGERIAPHKKVRIVEFVDQIPKSASGKILRNELRARPHLQH